MKDSRPLGLLGGSAAFALGILCGSFLSSRRSSGKSSDAFPLTPPPTLPYAERRLKAGVIQDLELAATLPYPLTPHPTSLDGHLVSTCVISKSKSIERLVKMTLSSRRVSGIDDPAITFSTLVELCLSKGATRLYVAGGFIRDVFQGDVADDLDFIFKCRGGNLVPWLFKVAEGRGWPTKKKINDEDKQTRFDYVAVGKGKMKFSGHPIGSGCEGEFAMNTLLYDVKNAVVIDPTGFGVYDAVNFTLRIPVPEEGWMNWYEEDRLPGMKVLRYYNFCGRGYQPINARTRSFVNSRMVQGLSSGTTSPAADTLVTFFKRKLLDGERPEEEAAEKAHSWVCSMRAEMGRGGVDEDIVRKVVDSIRDILVEKGKALPGLDLFLEKIK